MDPNEEKSGRPKGQRPTSKIKQNRSEQRQKQKKADEALYENIKAHLSKAAPTEQHRPFVNKATKVRLLEKTWFDPTWRRKWRRRWGKSKWKSDLRTQWIINKEWRLKWMSKLKNNWWNAKWRSQWREKFFEESWLKMYGKETKQKKRYWKRKWIKSGCKRMGLTFNEFLITQRNLRRFIRHQHHPPDIRQESSKRCSESIKKTEPKPSKRKSTWATINKKSMGNGIDMNGKAKSDKSFRHSLRKLAIKLKKKGNQLLVKDELNPAYLQFNLYFLNSVQGLAATLLVIYLFFSYGTSIPSGFAVFGLFLILICPSVMDIFGSIFGMVTAHYFHSFSRPKSKIDDGFFTCCKGHKLKGKLNEVGNIENPTETETEDEIPKRRRSSPEASKQNSAARTDSKSQLNVKSQITDKSGKKSVTAQDKHPPVVSNLPKQKCTTGCCGWCCRIVACFFKPGKSIDLVNRMGCLSYIFLLVAWFTNILFTGYYTWVRRLNKGYGEAVKKCSIFPREEHCYKFDNLYYYSALVVGVTFMLRNILQFCIGSCIDERLLRRTHFTDQQEHLLSDTDIDYRKVPKQILIPYLLSHRNTFPYKLPKAWRRQHGHISKKIKRFPSHSQSPWKKRHKKPQKRIISAQEREAKKMIQNYKNIRKATIPLRKGRRQLFKLPPVDRIAAPDRVQLPPELMTVQARRWLSEDENDSSDEGTMDMSQVRKSRPFNVQRRRSRDWLGDTNSLTIVHGPDSSSDSISEKIQPKIDNLSDRLSTDESWSGSNDSIFEATTPSINSEEEQERKRSYENYLEMMVFNEGDVADENAVPLI